MKAKKKSIDKVTPELLSIGLRAVGILIDIDTLDKIIDMVEIIEENGRKTSLKHLSVLEAQWIEHEKIQKAVDLFENRQEQPHGYI